MDEQAKKTALRRIPYGLFLLTAKNGDDIASGTVNWVTQTSFKPPMVAVGIKQDSHPYGVVKASGAFALNALGADQKDVAQTFFGTVKPEGDRLGPLTFTAGHHRLARDQGVACLLGVPRGRRARAGRPSRVPGRSRRSRRRTARRRPC